MVGGAREESPDVRAHLVVRLKAGWRYVPARRVFVSASGERLGRPGGLPKRTRIVHVVPDLAERDPGALSEDEATLAEHVLVIFPKGETPSDFMEEVGGWACVEDVQPSPEITLP